MTCSWTALSTEGAAPEHPRQKPTGGHRHSEEVRATVKPESGETLFIRSFIAKSKRIYYTNPSHWLLSIDPSNSLEQSIQPFTKRSSELSPPKLSRSLYYTSKGCQAQRPRSSEIFSLEIPTIYIQSP